MITVVSNTTAEAKRQSNEVPEAEAYRRILIVDPDLNSRRLAKKMLRSGFRRCRSYGAGSGEEALSIIERTEIDCVLLYEYTSDFRDLGLITHLTNFDSLNAIPVVVFGEQWSLELEQHALDAGAAAYIQRRGDDSHSLCSTLSNVIAHDRLMRVIDVQNQHIQALSEERARYIYRTDELAHELLTPLASIQEFVSLVLDEVSGPISETQGKHLAYARGGCSEIRSKVEALVVSQDFERILNGNA